MDARCLLRGRRDTFRTAGAICVAGVARSVPSYDVRGSLATTVDPWTPTVFLRGRRDTFSSSGAICVAAVARSVPS